MVYQLEKKYFPDQCFDKAFLNPKYSNFNVNGKVKRCRSGRRGEKGDNGVGDQERDKYLVFFEEQKGEVGANLGKNTNKDVTERKVEEFFSVPRNFPIRIMKLMMENPILLQEVLSFHLGGMVLMELWFW